MSHTPRTGPRLATAAGIVGALAAVVLGLLTFGVQATAAPRGLPLALAVPAGPAGQALAPLTTRLTERAGDAVDWRVTDREEAARLLDDADVYGILAVGPAPDRPAPDIDGLAVTTTTSGAVNPSATAAATQVLAGAGAAVAQAIAVQPGGAPPVAVEVVHPSTPAAASLPVGATSLLWLAAMAANVVLLLATRARAYPRGTALLTAAVVAVAGPAAAYGFSRLWGLDIAWTWSALGFLALVGAAFALLQAAVLRALGLRGIAVLAVLYLTAPAVAGLAPELMHPAYRVLLWSWTPIRFAADGLRTLLFSGGVAPAAGTATWVFVGLAAAGLLGLALPGRRRDDGRPASANHGAPVGVG